MGPWQIQEAKAHLGEVIKKAAKEGPQKITVRGESVAVIISNKEYQRFKQPKGSFVKFMRNSPLYGLELDLRHGQTLARKAPCTTKQRKRDGGLRNRARS